MKKNKLFLLGLFVVFAAVLSLSLVSNTLAKYTTSDNGSDTARVAKWGVVVDVEGTTFAKEYAKNDDSFTLGTNSVISSEKVLAPGTTGSFGGVTVSGTPEVAVRVTYGATVTVDGWAISGDDFYCPVVVTVEYGLSSATINGLEKDSASAFAAAIKAAIEGCTTDYVANESIVAEDHKLEISWAWAYADAPGQSDDNDTKLSATTSAITLDVTTTVTQIN